MSFYDSQVLPRVLNLACGSKPIQRQREKVVPHAEGRVLEVGIGTGLNLPYYDPAKVTHVVGLDPEAGMIKRARRVAARLPFEVEHLQLKGEDIPLEADSVDTVLITYTMCTIPDVATALGGMRRVLKPGGRLLFCEHGRAPDAGVARWQDRINPYWRRVFGGCNLNRDIPALLDRAGFRIDRLQTMYLPRTPRFAGFNYWGAATAA